MTKKLLALMPPHREYVEPFGGSAALLLAKPPALVETYNDIDSHVVNFFRVLKDEAQFAQFQRLACLTLHSRQEYDEALAGWRDEIDPVFRAYLWWICARESFSGGFITGWAYNRTQSGRGMAKHCAALLSSVDRLPEVVTRLRQVQIENKDWRLILLQHDAPTCLAYCDPPYVPGTRSPTLLYGRGGSHEMTLDDHRDLTDMLLEYRGMVMLSGYRHEVYEPLLEAGWQITEWSLAMSAPGRTRAMGIQGTGSAIEKGTRIECLYRNPAAVEALL